MCAVYAVMPGPENSFACTSEYACTAEALGKTPGWPLEIPWIRAPRSYMRGYKAPRPLNL
jgi:hypothetical protein